MNVNGTVSGLGRYPVKSIVGESADQLGFDVRGAWKDRHLAIINADGKIGSHKATRRFRPIADLYELAACVRDEQIFIRLPDGTELSSDDPQINDRLSQVLNQPVQLKHETTTPHHDDGPVHILTTASLRWLQSQLPTSDIDIRRFRPNIIVDVDGNSTIEQSWIDQTIQAGSVRLKITGPTERCVMTTLAQQDLPEDKAIARILANQADNLFGVYAKVVFPGVIHLNDAVSITAEP